ncbi:AAA family ATPase [Geitlerinema sp. PCC 9228]|jgi:predicted kinase|uniref:AAA family ATPase n=1 Tax=Geitlerinema sp. PCC 9228 TaxID=111611 RepID=UPI0008F9DCF4|nr:AAA family ATPase [Geitlerinema sp. PCC 9228]
MAHLIFLIGLPGSGKSYSAQKMLAEKPQRLLVSTDAIREQLFGDAGIQGAWLVIEKEIRQQFVQAVQQEKETIYDATNAQRRHRREAIALARSVGFTYLTGVWLDTPVQLCIERNQHRQRQVPEEIIWRMSRQLNDAPPRIEDGFDRLMRLDGSS